MLFLWICLRMIENFQLIAHRGASSYAPENTLAAFNAALNFGARYIECDISFTKDMVPVIFHDDLIDRTTNGRGALNKKNFTNLKNLDAGSWFSEKFKNEKILTLRELLFWHNQHQVILNLEIKKIRSSKLIHYITLILNEISAYSTNPAIIFSSFQKKVLMTLAILNDSSPKAYLVSRWAKKHVKTAKTLECIQLNVGARGLTSKSVEYTHDHDLKLAVYTVNDIKQAIYLKNIGVDAIFTDDLKLFAAEPVDS